MIAIYIISLLAVLIIGKIDMNLDSSIRTNRDVIAHWFVCVVLAITPVVNTIFVVGVLYVLFCEWMDKQR